MWLFRRFSAPLFATLITPRSSACAKSDICNDFVIIPTPYTGRRIWTAAFVSKRKLMYSASSNRSVACSCFQENQDTTAPAICTKYSEVDFRPFASPAQSTSAKTLKIELIDVPPKTSAAFFFFRGILEHALLLANALSMALTQVSKEAQLIWPDSDVYRPGITSDYQSPWDTVLR